MKIILHNPSHNGDQLFTLVIVKHLINCNEDKKFTIIPACCNYLFNELLSDRVTIEEHPVIWHHENKNIVNKNNFISENHNLLWNFYEGNIYINLWKLLVQDNFNCISLVTRPVFIKNMLNDIYNQTGIKIFFDCNDYQELIPNLPYINIDNIYEKLKNYNKKLIFFYNQNSFCGFELSYPNNINEIIIQDLINKYGEDHIIILSKPCNIVHKHLINVETEFGNVPSLDGKNLIINANIANLCDMVYFKTNGGSLFILNQTNINNKNVNYNYIGSIDFYNVIYNEYKLNCNLV